MEKINDVNIQALNYIKETIKGSKFDKHVYCMEGCARELFLGEKIQLIKLGVDLMNGCVELSRFLAKMNDSIDDSNPLTYDDEKYAYVMLKGINGNDNKVFVEIETMEKESGYTYFETHEIGTLKEHAATKTFTFDTLYINLSDGMAYDPLEIALDDINNKLIRTTKNADYVFGKNPEKMLMALQQACDNDFSIEKKTWLAIIKHAKDLKTSNLKDLEVELEVASSSKKFSTYVRYLMRSGILQVIMPYVYSLKLVSKTEEYDTDMFEHTLQVIDKLPNKSNLKMAALFHDTGKYLVEKETSNGGVSHYNHAALSGKISYETLTKLGYSDIVCKKIRKIIELHEKFFTKKDICPPLVTIKNFKKEAGDDIENALLLIDADNMCKSVNSQKPNQINLVRKALENIEEREKKESIRQILPINGKDLMDKFKLKPCSTIGLVFGKINEMFKLNPKMTKDDCLKAAEDELKKLNVI